MAAERDADFTEFVAVSRAQLSKIAWFIAADRNRAEDLLQEALVRTYLAWSRVRRDDAVGYVRKVMMNLSIDEWRKRRPEVLGGLPERPASDDTETSYDNRDAAIRALDQLTTRERAVVVMRYYLDLPEAQVAYELDMSVGTVKSTASRALSKVRQQLDSTNGGAR